MQHVTSGWKFKVQCQYAVCPSSHDSEREAQAEMESLAASGPG